MQGSVLWVITSSLFSKLLAFCLRFQTFIRKSFSVSCRNLQKTFSIQALLSCLSSTLPQEIQCLFNSQSRFGQFCTLPLITPPLGLPLPDHLALLEVSSCFISFIFLTHTGTLLRKSGWGISWKKSSRVKCLCFKAEQPIRRLTDWNKVLFCDSFNLPPLKGLTLHPLQGFTCPGERQCWKWTSLCYVSILSPFQVGFTAVVRALLGIITFYSRVYQMPDLFAWLSFELNLGVCYLLSCVILMFL